MAEGFDDSDKIRRNLVVFSTAILVGAFLNVKIEGSAKLLGIAEIAKPEPWKVWFVLSALVIYQLTRFRFDGGTGLLLHSAKEYLRNVTAPRVGNYLVRRLGRDIRRSGQSPVLVSTVLVDAIRNLEVLDVPGQLHSRTDEWKLASLTMTGAHEGGIWKGRHYFDVVTSAGESMRSTRTYADYSVPVLARPFIAARSLFQLVFYSKIGVDLLFPYLVGFGALGVCAWKFATAVLKGMP